MSAAFKLAKKKYSQQDLRRIMSETKASKQQQQSDGESNRIDSPLAKYNDAGQLMCVLCRSVVRSAAVWKVHLNSKQHKENVELAKKLKDASVAKSTEPSKLSNAPQSHLKRAGTEQTAAESVPVKKIKGILKNSTKPEVTQNGLPEDFFDNGTGNTANTVVSSIRKDLVNIRLPERHREQQHVESMDTEEAAPDAGGSKVLPDEEKLPEGFFDDPKMDAKARNQEYKDPNDEEWEKFQKEIKEATNVSMAIISEEQEESTAERQIAEIDEQIRNWSRVLDLEKKKEQVKTMKGSTDSEGRTMYLANVSQSITQTAEEDDREDDDDDEEFDEFLDWRAKKSFK
ncbi:zinc finger protein 830 [Anopheles maculipalpis]|uniref:zinc finger protein 830 n=1 Tax=Anopheles maculipalpis TaxID=1496333 RepID=UPI002159A17B|nr:zinc finger protein 830 [Anopheles maculipalpis]